MGISNWHISFDGDGGVESGKGEWMWFVGKWLSCGYCSWWMCGRWGACIVVVIVGKKNFRAEYPTYLYSEELLRWNNDTKDYRYLV